MVEKGQGGVIASRGYSYQDYVALNMFLENYNSPGFKGISIEQGNDCNLLYSENNKNISCQVKSNVETISQIKDVVHNLPEKESNYLICVSNVNNDLKNFIFKLDKLRENSDEDEAAKNTKINNHIKKSMSKLKNVTNNDINKLKNCKIKVIPQLDEHEYVYGTLVNCLENLIIFDSDYEGLLIELISKIAELRSRQGTLKKEDFLKILDKHKKHIDYSNSINILGSSLGLKADINKAIENISDNSIDNKEKLKMLLNHNNIDVVQLSDDLAKGNPNYEVIEESIKILFNVNIVSNDNLYIPKGLEDFYNLVEGIRNFKGNEFVEAKKNLTKIKHKNKFKTNIDFLLGLIEFNLKNYKDAINIFESVAKEENKKIKCLVLYSIYLCKIFQNYLYSNLGELEKAHSLDPQNMLVSMTLVQRYAFFKRYEDVMATFENMDINNLNTDDKISCYLCYLIANERSNKKNIKNIMLNLVNLMVSKLPERDIVLIYIDIDSAEVLKIIYDSKSKRYSFRFGNNQVSSLGHPDSKIGLTVGLDPSDFWLEETYNKLSGTKISIETLISQKFNPEIIIFNEANENISQAMEADGIILNHDYKEWNIKEYIAQEKSNISIYINFCKERTEGYIRIGDEYGNAFKISKVTDGTKLFKKRLWQTSKILIVFMNNDKWLYLEVPKKLVNISY